jgi:hypothetical protein
LSCLWVLEISMRTWPVNKTRHIRRRHGVALQRSTGDKITEGNEVPLPSGVWISHHRSHVCPSMTSRMPSLSSSSPCFSIHLFLFIYLF